MLDPLRPHGLQPARLPCPSPTSRACSNSCPSSQWCPPTISSSVLPSIFSSIRVFSNESVLPSGGQSTCSFSLSISPSSEYPGLISFRIDWLDLFAVQGTLKSLLKHHSSKASIFCAQLSLRSNSCIHAWLLERPKLWLDRPLSAK